MFPEYFGRVDGYGRSLDVPVRQSKAVELVVGVFFISLDDEDIRKLRRLAHSNESYADAMLRLWREGAEANLRA